MLDGIKILVVEDSALNQKIVNFMLKKHGASLVMAMNGIEAIEILKGEDVDVILMDLQMPGMDGFATTEFIRKNLRLTTPIIALTADIFAMQGDEILKVGMNAYIAKPFDINQLSNLILSLVGAKKLNPENKTV